MSLFSTQSMNGNAGPRFLRSLFQRVQQRRQPSAEAQSYFNAQPAADQDAIRQSWGGQNQMQQWFNNAKAAGAVPAQITAQTPGQAPGQPVGPATASTLSGAIQAIGQQSPQQQQPGQTGFQEQLQSTLGGMFSDPYEAAKQARMGPRATREITAQRPSVGPRPKLQLS